MRAVELLDDNENKPAPGDLRFVQGYINSLDLESGVDRFATPEGLARWLTTHASLPAGAVPTEAERRRAVDLREALRTLLTEGRERDPEALAVLEEVGERGAVRFTVTDEGSVALVPVGGDVDAALAELLAVVHHAMIEGTWQRLKTCASDSCRWAFYDASRNRSGAWCSMETCGNRAKVHAHRSRERRSEA